jgi:hypothetical protein
MQLFEERTKTPSYHLISGVLSHAYCSKHSPTYQDPIERAWLSTDRDVVVAMKHGASLYIDVCLGARDGDNPEELSRLQESRKTVADVKVVSNPHEHI